LFFYTDGITEAMNKSEDEFGTERLIKVIESKSATPDKIINEVHDFTSGNTQSDDITVVMIEAE
jgi:sigma-B regulation protein RsbU (phosphoserine phosphatase)